MRVFNISTIMTALVLMGCGSPTDSQSCEDLESSPSLASSEGWETEVHAVLNSAPGDSMIYAVFGGILVNAHEFRQAVADAGGEIAYEFGTVAAMSVRISVSGFAALVQEEMHSYINIGRPGGGPLICG